MKVSLSWLKEYIPVDMEPADLASELTMAGLEVEAMEDRFAWLGTEVVVGRVKSVKKHPNADKLTCCRVDTGSGEVSIICGAPNVREGLTVACALPGAVLPGDFKIKNNKIRGEKSEGMICSGSELKLSSDSGGIMELDDGLEPGTTLSEALELSDYVFEIDLTPNRPDCLSVLGVAREVGALLNPPEKATYPDYELYRQRTGDFSISDYTDIAIEDPDLCPRYAAGLILDVKVGPSPSWLRHRLESVGLAPVNNIVDVTNYVMLETGQPLHAFDFDLLAENRIVVRRLGETTEFTTLDGKVHSLDPETLMICDGEKPVAIAGVMGGGNSEISDDSGRVLLESACFNPVSIRKTAKKTGIATDASHRFERGADPDGAVNALKRAIYLLSEVSGGTPAADFIDENPVKSEETSIPLDIDFLNRRLGTSFDAQSVKAILDSVEFTTEIEDTNRLFVKVPSFRVDVERPEDLSEEVARLWGYNHIETSFPKVQARGGKVSAVTELRGKIKTIMCGFGFTEAINYNFTSADSCDRLGIGPADPRRQVTPILNPISEEMAVLRTTLLPGLIENMKLNLSMQTDTFRLFEIGNTFLPSKSGTLPDEREMIAGLWTGSGNADSIHFKKRPCDFYDIKGILESLLAAFHIKGAEWVPANEENHPYLLPGFAAEINLHGKPFASVGRVQPAVLKEFSVKQEAFVFEADMKILLASIPETITSLPMPRFPSTSRDITLIVDARTRAGSVLKELETLVDSETLAESAHLFDMYQGSTLPEGKKSLSFRVVYRSVEKTLKDKMVKGLHEKISQALIRKFNADVPEI
ncbi:MAG: phenylalanine--tRNA ligase subunit beta [Desulfarculaceae bacterium]|nr:phenylalanine--tRNA ligase subunit beta [Desulfarculaceae bacterium]